MLNQKKVDTKVLNELTAKPITFTYTTNSYVNSTDFARINGYRVGKIAVINFNLYLSATIPQSGSATIGSMDVSALATQYIAIPCQSSANHLMISLSGSSISVSNGYSTNLTGGWYRGIAVIPIS